MKNSILKIFDDENLHLNESLAFGTDKLSKHGYDEYYEILFKPLRNKKISLLEIGAYHGGSTIFYDKYFPLANITVVDINPRQALENILGRVDPNRTKILIGDAYNPNFASKLDSFDLINDDGPHDLHSMISCLNIYYPKLNPSGLLIIEDIPFNSWFTILKREIPRNAYSVCVEIPNKATDSRFFACWK